MCVSVFVFILLSSMRQLATHFCGVSFTVKGLFFHKFQFIESELCMHTHTYTNFFQLCNERRLFQVTLHVSFLNIPFVFISHSNLRIWKAVVRSHDILSLTHSLSLHHTIKIVTIDGWDTKCDQNSLQFLFYFMANEMNENENSSIYL